MSNYLFALGEVKVFKVFRLYPKFD